MTDAVANNVLVEALGSALRDGENGLSTVPGLLKKVLAEQSWRSFQTRRGQIVEHARFAAFVTTPPLAGLGATVDLVRRVISADVEALSMLDEALQNPSGRPETFDNIQESAPTGTSKEAALRRLRKDAPELHAEVLAGHLSTHAAMVKAGYRPRTVTVPIERPASVAAALRKHMTEQQLAELRELLA